MSAGRRGTRAARVLELFGKAVELAPGELDAFLVANCGEDATLGQEIQSLVRADRERDDVFLEGSPIGAGRADIRLDAHMRIGRYTIIELIGEGSTLR